MLLLRLLPLLLLLLPLLLLPLLLLLLPPVADLQGPLWQVAGQRWLPQRSFLLHTSSQGGQLPSQQRRLRDHQDHTHTRVHVSVGRMQDRSGSVDRAVWHNGSAACCSSLVINCDVCM